MQRQQRRDSRPHAPLPWRMRWLAVRAALTQVVTGEHVYLSTACLAGEHDYCDQMVGMQGAKRPGLSKFTGQPCICPHHRAHMPPRHLVGLVAV